MFSLEAIFSNPALCLQAGILIGMGIGGLITAAVFMAKD